MKEDFTVFEYGSGNSTVWWAKHTKRVVACEDNEDWYRRVKQTLPGNAKIVLCSPSDKAVYAKTILKEKQRFNIIVIDGSWRVECAKISADCLSQEGIIIFDNSNRGEYAAGIIFLKNRGFKEIPFFGLAGIDNANNVTSIFYREQNCLGI